MYKVTIEEILGEVKRVTTLETEDVDLVKTIFEIGNIKEVKSDVHNLNIDPEWQSLLQWYRKQKDIEQQISEEIIDGFNRIEKHKQHPGTPIIPAQPYVNPFSRPYDPHSPFTVTC